MVRLAAMVSGNMPASPAAALSLHLGLPLKAGMNLVVMQCMQHEHQRGSGHCPALNRLSCRAAPAAGKGEAFATASALVSCQCLLHDRLWHVPVYKQTWLSRGPGEPTQPCKTASMLGCESIKQLPVLTSCPCTAGQLGAELRGGMDAQDRWQSLHDSCAAHGWLCDHAEVKACADIGNQSPGNRACRRIPSTPAWARAGCLSMLECRL